MSAAGQGLSYGSPRGPLWSSSQDRRSISGSPASSVSVVIPVRNGALTIAQSIASAVSQSIAPLEILVIDDGSTDDTVAIAQAGGARVILREAAFGSPSGARNAGIAAAKGDWVAFLDADDLWHPGKLEAQLAAAAGHPQAVAVVSEWVRDQGRWPQRTNRGPQDLISYSDLLVMNRFQTSTVLARREALEAIGGFVPFLDGVEDWDCWLRLSKFGPIVRLDYPYVVYRDTAGGVSKDLHALYERMWVMLEREREAMGGGDRELEIIFAWHHLRFAVNWLLDNQPRAAIGALQRLVADGLVGSVPAAVATYLAPFLAKRAESRAPSFTRKYLERLAGHGRLALIGS